MRVRDQLRRARDDRSGAVAIIFALALVPVVAMGGAAVDYSRTQQAASVLQSALDVAAIAAANKGPDLTEAEIEALARTTVEQRLGSETAAVLTGLKAVRADKTISLTGQARISTAFMRVIGVGVMDVHREAQSTYGMQHIDVALVLDNTGSMGQSGKITELKRALCGDTRCSNPNNEQGFVGIMREAAREEDRIRVGLVPFDTTVRMPLDVQEATARATATADTFAAPRNDGYCAGGAGSDDAQRVGIFRFAGRDRNAQRGNPCGSPRPAPATWNGCVWDRDQNRDLDIVDDGQVLTDIRTLHPAVTCRSNSLARIFPLADVWTQNARLVGALADMSPSGNTNLTIGVSWGLALLTAREPFTEAGALPRGVDQGDVLRYMIVLTDGDNTENKSRGSRGAIDDRTLRACRNAKDAGITVITVRVIAGNRNLLRDCASGPEHYYEVSQAAQLTAAFREIADRIGSVRLTQ